MTTPLTTICLIVKFINAVDHIKQIEKSISQLAAHSIVPSKNNRNKAWQMNW
jgi:hypothetical protein